MALGVFDDAEQAREWFSARNGALSGKTPNAVARTERGRTDVYKVLVRLEHGVYS